MVTVTLFECYSKINVRKQLQNFGRWLTLAVSRAVLEIGRTYLQEGTGTRGFSST